MSYFIYLLHPIKHLVHPQPLDTLLCKNSFYTGCVPNHFPYFNYKKYDIIFRVKLNMESEPGGPRANAARPDTHHKMGPA